MEEFEVDSELDKVNKKIQELEESANRKPSSKKEFDDMPVVACKYCNSLHVLKDDLENDICARCGAVNEIKVYNNIVEYLNNDIREE